MKQEFDSLLKAVRVYTDYFGYGLERTITSPNIGDHVYATMLRFDAFNGKLYIKVDHSENQWVVSVYIKDAEDNKTFDEEVKSSDSFIQTSRKVQAMLSKLPRNEYSTPMQESFLRDFDSSTLYIVEREFMEIIRQK